MCTMNHKSRENCGLKTIRKYQFSAYAKINLHLAIGEKRQDGFHDLQSIFLLVNLCDTLSFCYDKNSTYIENGMQGIQIEIITENLPQVFLEEIKNLPQEKNIVFKAVQLFKEKTGFEFRGKIKITKRIPSAAGLGGGSSDAAATIMALNKIGSTNCLPDVMYDMAEQLGSDVPFFLSKMQCAYVCGRGEQINHIKEPTGLCYVLVNPGLKSNTKTAFNLIDTYREEKKIEKIFSLVLGQRERNILAQSLQIDPMLWKFKNDFTGAFVNCINETGINYEEILQDIKKNGAAFANISGSGATCFGVFKNKKTAAVAVKKLQTKYPFVQYCL
ncbi:MAG: 4-(cytidine 5'-diphospho)-2-C-methyl-D-erythritol kinase [Termitinemataceae bacterium]|nr:MAG: 4-(cytidine 5'-diphospho)-2-C-methyl-D-erythritol kinase [Termitinemataceae bacterium]